MKTLKIVSWNLLRRVGAAVDDVAALIDQSPQPFPPAMHAGHQSTDRNAQHRRRLLVAHLL